MKQRRTLTHFSGKATTNQAKTLDGINSNILELKRQPEIELEQTYTDRKKILNGVVRVTDVLALIRTDCYMTLREAEDYSRLSRKVLLKAPHYPVKAGEYKTKKSCGKILFKRSELDAWIQQNTKGGKQELSSALDRAVSRLREAKG